MIKRTIFAALLSLLTAFVFAGGGAEKAKQDSGAALESSTGGSPLEPAAEVQSLPGESGSADSPLSDESRLVNDTSYAIGMWVGMSMMQDGMIYDFNYSELMNGIRDVIDGRELRLSTEEAIALMQRLYGELQAKAAEESLRVAEDNLRAGEAFLAENGERGGVFTVESGLQYEILKQGTGPHPTIEDTVEINLELSLVDGTVLGSSFGTGETVNISVSAVIPGFQEGLQLMPVGSTYLFYLPPHLAYGERGDAGIPPNSTLIFKIELLSIIIPGEEP
jgi:FKBP-type peptidyl-prolyl cis-trans isomerase